ncbi:hypothetical protein YTPLAS73_13000 [Nitrosarchaeum sp.]|nr:hypothetical protein YTPLAS73_13000 [Nitrosarchaeum sp.]
MALLTDEIRREIERILSLEGKIRSRKLEFQVCENVNCSGKPFFRELKIMSDPVTGTINKITIDKAHVEYELKQYPTEANEHAEYYSAFLKAQEQNYEILKKMSNMKSIKRNESIEIAKSLIQGLMYWELEVKLLNQFGNYNKNSDFKEISKKFDKLYDKLADIISIYPEKQQIEIYHDMISDFKRIGTNHITQAIKLLKK